LTTRLRQSFIAQVSMVERQSTAWRSDSGDE
jgi:hypothetical protein